MMAVAMLQFNEKHSNAHRLPGPGSDEPETWSRGKLLAYFLYPEIENEIHVGLHVIAI